MLCISMRCQKIRGVFDVASVPACMDVRFDLTGYDLAVEQTICPADDRLSGYRCIDQRFPGLFVPLDMAEEYALRMCGLCACDQDAPDHEEALQAIVEWYFSGPWVPVYGR